MKLCKDCKWCEVLSWAPQHSTCGCPKRPFVQRMDPVQGWVDATVTFCSVLREFDRPDFCGPEAKWFEARPVVVPAVSWWRRMLSNC